MTTIASRRRGNSRSWTTGWPRSVVQGMVGIGQIRRHIGDANLAGNN